MGTARAMYEVTINGAVHLMMLDPAGVAAYGDRARPAGSAEAPAKKAAPKPANKSRTARNKTK